MPSGRVGVCLYMLGFPAKSLQSTPVVLCLPRGFFFGLLPEVSKVRHVALPRH